MRRARGDTTRDRFLDLAISRSHFASPAGHQLILLYRPAAKELPVGRASSRESPGLIHARSESLRLQKWSMQASLSHRGCQAPAQRSSLRADMLVAAVLVQN